MNILFPHDKLRDVQKEVVDKVVETFEHKKNLIMHAPTGIGKTAATLAPALKYAMDKGLTVFFLTSRHTQHHIAIETLKKIKEKHGLKFLTTDLIGKKWMCGINGIQMLRSGEFSEYCRKVREDDKCEFYNNLYSKQGKMTVKARKVAQDLEDVSPNHTEAVIDLCKEEKICPYYMSMFLTKNSKVIVTDYFYLFNNNIRDSFLSRIGKELSKSIIIVDEAHNLPSRVRDLMSEQINSYVIMQAVKEAETLKHEELVVTLNTIKDIMNNLATTIREGNETSIIKQAFKNQIDELGDYFQIIADLEDAAEEIRQNKKRSFMGSVAAFLEAWNGPDEGFVRIIRVKKGKEEVVELSYKCLDPSLVTEDVFEESYSSVLMSGTLTPLDMYKDLLGLSDSCMLESFSSPFPEENKLSLIVPSVTTKYNKRGEDQFKRIAFICVGATDSTPGNSVVFFPSYELLNKVNHYFQYSCKKTLFLEQPGMTKQDKFELLEKFRQYKDSGAILLSVISGSFGEGIDLPGDYLKTVIVVGLPLQTPNLETKALIDYYDQKFGDGWNYGYVYPAFNKTLQSAGRCIRSETDRGVVLFLDERYLWPNYFKCFPEAHRPEVDLNYVDRINSFFEK